MQLTVEGAEFTVGGAEFTVEGAELQYEEPSLQQEEPLLQQEEQHRTDLKIRKKSPGFDKIIVLKMKDEQSDEKTRTNIFHRSVDGIIIVINKCSVRRKDGKKSRHRQDIDKSQTRNR